MHEVPRVTPEEIYPKLRSGAALLVCAYDDEAKFKRLRLEGAISLEEFKSLRPTLPQDREIVFYCA
jgi:rhodanese-related sulfurtransferase